MKYSLIKICGEEKEDKKYSSDSEDPGNAKGKIDLEKLVNSLNQKFST